MHRFRYTHILHYEPQIAGRLYYMGHSASHMRPGRSCRRQHVLLFPPLPTVLEALEAGVLYQKR